MGDMVLLRPKVLLLFFHFLRRRRRRLLHLGHPTLDGGVFGDLCPLSYISVSFENPEKALVLVTRERIAGTACIVPGTSLISKSLGSEPSSWYDCLGVVKLVVLDEALILATAGSGTPTLDTLVSAREGLSARFRSISLLVSNMATAYVKNPALSADTLSVHLYSLNLSL